MKMTRAKINKTQVQQTSVRANPQTESASSNTVASRCPPIALDIVAKIENESLFKNKFIMIGNIKTAIAIIAMMPHEFLISERLAVTVFNDSLTLEPTKGTKLLIANLAVFIEIVSTPCAIVFL